MSSAHALLRFGQRGAAGLLRKSGVVAQDFILLGATMCYPKPFTSLLVACFSCGLPARCKPMARARTGNRQQGHEAHNPTAAPPTPRRFDMFDILPTFFGEELQFHLGAAPVASRRMATACWIRGSCTQVIQTCVGERGPTFLMPGPPATLGVSNLRRGGTRSLAQRRVQG